MELSSNNNRNIFAINMLIMILGICFAYQLGTVQATGPSSNYSNVESNSTLGGHSGNMEHDHANQANETVSGQLGMSNDTSDAGVNKTFKIEDIKMHNTYSDADSHSESHKIYPANLISGKPIYGKFYTVSNTSVVNEPTALTSVKMIWHVGIYSKVNTLFVQICGGTLVTTKTVISAAHCFWNTAANAPLPARKFAVGAGKRYRLWKGLHDSSSQKSDVAAIAIPIRYRDSDTSYQDDIAVVLLTQELMVTHAVRPACVNFDEKFDNEQLTEGNTGTILGWGLTAEDGEPSPVLNYLKIPSVSIEKCLRGADASFLRYITSDKICAGVTTGKAMSLCRGDSGGGLVFMDQSGDAAVPYLRGVASTAPRNEHRCNAHALSALTHVRAHRDFLKRHIPDLEEECKKHFPAVQDRYEKYEKQPENLASGQPGQFICNCNCFCNNTAPTQDNIISYN